MKSGQGKIRKTWLQLGVLLCSLAALSVQAAPPAGARLGKLSGVVLDPSGTPQMGATVLLITESVQSATNVELLTDPRGVFASQRLLPGYYTVRVTLAGFLPSVERHVRVTAHLTTLVRVELDSIFTSLDRLRRQPPPSSATPFKLATVAN